VVTNLRGATEWLYDTLDCARGQAKNLIKLHKSQLAMGQGKGGRQRQSAPASAPVRLRT
jgi:hypothetical protein